MYHLSIYRSPILAQPVWGEPHVSAQLSMSYRLDGTPYPQIIQATGVLERILAVYQSTDYTDNAIIDQKWALKNGRGFNNFACAFLTPLYTKLLGLTGNCDVM